MAKNEQQIQTGSLDSVMDRYIIAEEVMKYIGQVEGVIIDAQRQEEQQYVIGSLKESEISVKVASRNKLKEGSIVEDLILEKQDSQIGENIFIGTNPGLFYSRKSDFDDLTVHNVQKLVSISQLLSPKMSEKKITLEQSAKQSLQISGDTILDISTSTESNEQEPHLEQHEKDGQHKIVQGFTETKIVEEKSDSFNAQQQKTFQHSRYCDAVKSTEKQHNDFIIPVITNESSQLKSGIKTNQYLPMNDPNLTKFFVTKAKRKYVENFGQQKLKDSKFTDKESQYSKTFSRSSKHNQGKRNSKTNRESSASHPNFRQNGFCLRQQDENMNSNMASTKFSIKVIPSNKTKRLFNQSLSTFISQNYRPITSKQQFRKLQTQCQNKQMGRQTLKENICGSFAGGLKANDKVEKKSIQQTFSCDNLALKYSFKKINQNSIKGKKISFNKTNNDSKSLVFPTQNLKSYIQSITTQYQNSKFSESKFRPIQTSDQNIAKNQKENFNKETLQTKSSQKRFENMKKRELEMMKNNNMKRVVNFQRIADAKLNIVKRMGVKISPD